MQNSAISKRDLIDGNNNAYDHELTMLNSGKHYVIYVLLSKSRFPFFC